MVQVELVAGIEPTGRGFGETVVPILGGLAAERDGPRGGRGEAVGVEVGGGAEAKPAADEDAEAEPLETACVKVIIFPLGHLHLEVGPARGHDVGRVTDAVRELRACAQGHDRERVIGVAMRVRVSRHACPDE